MKKTAMLIMTFIASCAAFIALSGKASAASATAVINNIKDGDNEITFEYDADGDSLNDSLIKVTLFDSGETATINRIFTRATDITIPGTFKVNYPSGTREYHPMILGYIYPENGQDLKSVTVPECVQLFVGEPFGYSSNGTKYDRGSTTAPNPVHGDKLTSLKVICQKNSVAATYASRLGLTAQYIENKLDPFNIKVSLKTHNYSYTGSAVCPEYTLTDSTGLKITKTGTYIGSNYSVVYRSNTKPGSASLVAVSNSSADEITLATFYISKPDLTNDPKLKIIKIGKGSYNGNLSAPDVELTYDSVPLRKSADYIISIDNSSFTGSKAKGSIIFLGSYSGSVPIEFEVEKTASPITGFTAVSTDNGTFLSWDPIDNCTMVYIYRRNEKTRTEQLINVVGKSTFTYLDASAPEKDDCTYYISAYISGNGISTTYSSDKVTVSAKYSDPEAKFTIGSGKITISWNKTNADGYIVFMDGQQIYDTKSGDVTSYTKTGLTNYEKHIFSVKSYTMSNGKISYGFESEDLSTLGVDSILNSAKTDNRRSFKMINRQSAADKTSTIDLTDDDFAIMEKFAAENFTADMTDADKLEYTLNWINRNLKYATAANWNTINNKSYVDAAFNYRLGQCAQYNGAMVSMMRYLGYEANLIVGNRGIWNSNYWQHLWGEVEIDGLRYLIETGNYGSSGSWSFLLVPYERADGRYIMNGRNIAVQRYNDYNPWGGSYYWW